MKTSLKPLLVAVVLCTLVLNITTHFSIAQTGTNASGVISQDATWTKTNSPYSLTGPIAVNQGVTLTIEAGTTVNLNSYYIQVNGTLTAIGTPTENINFNGGSAISQNNLDGPYTPSAITFYPSSPSWNEQSNRGSIIENAKFNGTQVGIYNSAKIAGTDNSGILVNGGSPIISNNVNCGINVYNGAPIISNNLIIGGITVYFGSPKITNNTITGGPGYGIALGPRYALDDTNKIVVANNIIYGSFDGGCLIASGDATIQGNLLVDSWYMKASALSIAGAQSKFTIQNNTIAGSSTGLTIESGTSSSLNLAYNNFVNISQHLVYSSSINNYNLQNNWWGTTDAVAINQSIYDFKNDFNLGNVSFIPFLTEPNPQAPTALNPSPIEVPTQAPFSTPSASPSSSSSSPIPEFQLWTLTFLLLPITLLALIFKRKRVKT